MSQISKIVGKDANEEKRVAGAFDVFILGIAIQLGGFFGGWNYMYVDGMWGMLIATVYIGVLYLLLTLCLAELSSAISFSGGSFGYARCTLGPFFGYLIGASEFLQNIIYVATCVIVTAQAVLVKFDLSQNYLQATCLLFYVLMFIIHSLPLHYYWKSIRVFGVFTMIVVILYLFGTFPFIDFQKNVMDRKESEFSDNYYNFTEYFFYTTFFYIGIEIVPLSANQVIEPKKNIPIGIIGSTLFCFVFSMIIIFACAAISPGIGEELGTADFPLIYGFKIAYHLPYKFGILLGIIPIFSSCLGFMYGCKQQMHSLALSGILPKFLKPTHSIEDIKDIIMKWISNNTVAVAQSSNAEANHDQTPTANNRTKHQQPLRCLLLTSTLQYLYILLQTMVMHSAHPYQICCIGASSVYFGLFCAYIVFKTRFSGLTREFESPVGIAGGVVGAFLSLTMWIMMVFLQQDATEVVKYLVFMTLAIIYYFAYAQKHQFFSKEEQEKFMKAYILNANAKKKKGKANFAKTGASNNNTSTNGTETSKRSYNLVNMVIRLYYFVNGVVIEDNQSRSNANTNASAGSKQRDAKSVTKALPQHKSTVDKQDDQVIDDDQSEHNGSTVSPSVNTQGNTTVDMYDSHKNLNNIEIIDNIDVDGNASIRLFTMKNNKVLPNFPIIADQGDLQLASDADVDADAFATALEHSAYNETTSKKLFQLLTSDKHNLVFDENQLLPYDDVENVNAEQQKKTEEDKDEELETSTKHDLRDVEHV